MPEHDVSTVDGSYQHGLELARAGRFFDAHEELELPWKEAQGETKTVLQGLIQIAAGLHRYRLAPKKCLQSPVAFADFPLQPNPADSQRAGDPADRSSQSGARPSAQSGSAPTEVDTRSTDDGRRVPRGTQADGDRP